MTAITHGLRDGVWRAWVCDPPSKRRGPRRGLVSSMAGLSALLHCLHGHIHVHHAIVGLVGLHGVLCHVHFLHGCILLRLHGVAGHGVHVSLHLHHRCVVAFHHRIVCERRLSDDHSQSSCCKYGFQHDVSPTFS